MSDPPRNCCSDGDRARELIVLETSGELPGDLAYALDGMVARCPECRAARSDYARTAAQLDLAFASELPAFGSTAARPGTRRDVASIVSRDDTAAPEQRASASAGVSERAGVSWPRWLARAAALVVAAGLGYLTGVRHTAAPEPRESRLEPHHPIADPAPGDPRIEAPPVAPGSTARRDPDPPIPAATHGTPPSDPVTTLDELCRREVERAGAPSTAVAARAFFAGRGRGWLVATIREAPTPSRPLLDVAREALAPLSEVEAAAFVGHGDVGVQDLALDLGTRPDPARPLDRWWALAASPDLALARRVGGLLLELGPAALVAQPLTSWPPGLVQRALEHRDWPRALARLASSDDAIGSASRDLLARIPDDAIVAQLEEALARTSPSDTDAVEVRACRALLLVLAERPAREARGPTDPPRVSLAALACGTRTVAAFARALDTPALAAPAAAALDRWASIVDARDLARALANHDRVGVRVWVGRTRAPAELLLELASVNPSRSLSRTALVAVAAAHSPQFPALVLPALIERYLAGDDGAALAGAAAALIAGSGPHRVSLWRLASSGDERTRKLGLAALALAGAGVDDPRILLDRLREGDSDWNQRVLAMFERWSALAPHGAERAAAFLAQHVATGRVARADAVAYVAARRLPGWAALAERALDSPDAHVQLAALAALERPAGEEAVRAVRRLRRAPDPQVRAGAYLALGRIAVAAEVDALRAGLDDPEPQVRRAAVVGLGLTGDPKAVQPLLTALSDVQVPVAELAGKSLENLTAWSTAWPARPTPEALDQYRGQWSRWWNAHREEGQHVWLRAAIDSGEPARRALAARALARDLEPTARALLDHARREAPPAERQSGDTARETRGWIELARTATPELALECAEAALASQPLAALDLLVRGFGPDEPAAVSTRRRALLARELGIDAADDEDLGRWWLAARPLWTAR